MARAEYRGVSSEQQQAYQQIAGFFGRAEREFPKAVEWLVNVVGGLVGDQQTTQKELQAGMGNVDVGLALIGDWLKEAGAAGFEVKLGAGGGVRKAVGKRRAKFPSVSDLTRGALRVDWELQRQILPLLSSFSRHIEGALDIGLTPRQIVGGLVAESAGSRLSANGSANLREALNKPLGGHLEWIREALKIPDVAGQQGFTPKESATKLVKKAEPVGRAEKISPMEREFQRKKARIRRYLLEEDGMDFLDRFWDNSKWEHFGEDGVVKAVYKPRNGVLQREDVCLRRNVFDQIVLPTRSAADLRIETRFLKQMKGTHFVKVYAHAPLNDSDQEGVGSFDSFRHWELVEFVEGTTVERNRRGVWPETLPPSVRLKVVLVACHCQHEATHLPAPVYLADLKTDAFIVLPDGTAKMVDVQVHDDYVERSAPQIVSSLGGLLCELFSAPGDDITRIERAIRGYLSPEWDKRDRGGLGSLQPPTLEMILNRSDMSKEVKREFLGFLNEVQGEYGSGVTVDLDRKIRLKFDEVPMDLARRILPIMQRLEREETAAEGEEFARRAREEEAARLAREDAGRRVEEKKSWQEVALEMKGNPFAKIGYERTGNEVVAAAAFEFRAEIGNKTMSEEVFVAMMQEINTIAKTYEAKLGRPKEQKLPWPQMVEDMGRSNIAETAFNSTGSRIVAAAAYRFRQRILTSQDQGASFKAMMREINKRKA